MDPAQNVRGPLKPAVTKQAVPPASGESSSVSCRSSWKNFQHGTAPSGRGDGFHEGDHVQFNEGLRRTQPPVEPQGSRLYAKRIFRAHTS